MNQLPGDKIPDMVEFGFEGNKTTIKEGHNVFGMQMVRSTYEGTKKLMNGRRPFDNHQSHILRWTTLFSHLNQR